MSNVQIRNVPPELRRRLKERAAERKQSLSAYLLEELEWLANTLTTKELIARVESRGLYDLGDTAALIREEREERERRLARR